MHKSEYLAYRCEFEIDYYVIMILSYRLVDILIKNSYK